MCGGAKRNSSSTGLSMEGGEFQNQDGGLGKCWVLLELAASNDLIGFRAAVEVEGHDIDEPSCWYGRRIGSKKMGFEERTPLMIASMYGSKRVLSYILETGLADVNRASGSDGATALHCAVAGGSSSSPEVVKLLLDASADVKSLDANGNHSADLMGPSVNSSFNLRRKALECLLKASSSVVEGCLLVDESVESLEELDGYNPGSEKKEYPVDLSLPDIKNGIYGTDEFRMYSFKVKPCSRAYPHDWTECPFAHPGENARRRDPRKYLYSCVPCADFRKGTCIKGDTCEYAHGIFECWLHPAQYRTRLCKDETGCNRRVCFFAHKREELRPLYASTGSAVPSPKSFLNNFPLEMALISQLALCSPSFVISPTSTPPMTPSGAASPMGRSSWQSQPSMVSPALLLTDSRLKNAQCARDMNSDAELLGIERHHLQQQLLIDELSAFASSGDHSGGLNRLGRMKPTNLDNLFGSLDPAVLTQLEGLSLDASSPQVQSPGGIQIRQNMRQQLRLSYPSSLSSSPVRGSLSFGMDPSGAAAVLSSRSAAFAKRSQSFIDRSGGNRPSDVFSSPAFSTTAVPSALSDWGSPDGKLDWGVKKDDLNKLRKSASFGVRSSGGNFSTSAVSMLPTIDEPDISWVQTVLKDAPSLKPQNLAFEEQQHQQYHLNDGSSEGIPSWVEQYMEQEQEQEQGQMVA